MSDKFIYDPEKGIPHMNRVEETEHVLRSRDPAANQLSCA